MKYTEFFKKIGFSEKEAGVYLQLIHLGPQAASTLSRNTNINRTTMYDVMEALKKRGIVRSVSSKGITVFEALPAKELVNFLERKKDETIRTITKQQRAVEEILPELISLENPKSTKPKVSFYEGENGMREAYEDTLNSEGPILAYANVEEMHKGLPNFFPEYYKRRAVDRKIHIKAILPDNEESIKRAAKDEEENRESMLVAKEEYEFSPEINIYNNKVLLASWCEKMAIVIESQEIADFHRKMFKLCWKEAKRMDEKKGKEGGGVQFES
jgi:sugar-specific transcriptional regulator TrmB